MRLFKNDCTNSYSKIIQSAFTRTLAIGLMPLLSSLAHSAVSGKGLNPDISVNLLGRLQYGTGLSNDRNSEAANGLSFEEAEMQFTSDVDPYIRASALFAIAPEDGEFAFEVEEAYFETLSLPAITLRLGKFKSAFGKHNELHAHAFPFLDAPLINETLFGGEGLNEMSFSASALLPTNWFSEITVQAINLSNDAFFDAAKSSSMGAVARLKNLWDLNEATTLELGLSGLTGTNKAVEKSEAWGGSLTLKWRPTVGGKYQSLEWTSEYIGSMRNGWRDENNVLTEGVGGISTALHYQATERLRIGTRYERLGLPRAGAVPMLTKVSAIAGIFPSEFSGFRLQYSYEKPHAEDVDHFIGLQYNLSIGAHPAHTY